MSSVTCIEHRKNPQQRSRFKSHVASTLKCTNLHICSYWKWSYLRQNKNFWKIIYNKKTSKPLKKSEFFNLSRTNPWNEITSGSFQDNQKKFYTRKTSKLIKIFRIFFNILRTSPWNSCTRTCKIHKSTFFLFLLSKDSHYFHDETGAFFFSFSLCFW